MSENCKHLFFGSFPSERVCLWCGGKAPETFCECKEPASFKNDKGVDICSDCFKPIDTKKCFRLYMDKSYIGDNVCVKSMLEPDIKSAMDYAIKSERLSYVEIIKESDEMIRFKGSIWTGKVCSYRLIAE